DRSADAVETEIRNVVLTAGIKTAADLDMKIANRFVEREKFFGQASADLARESARRRNTEFARVRARARDDVENGAGARITQSDAYELAIEIRKIGYRRPPKER